jgi:aryl-alcohol dehydrogenase-like predicted oxidoreductase
MSISITAAALPLRQFGKTDMAITQVGFGSWAIGGRTIRRPSSLIRCQDGRTWQ